MVNTTFRKVAFTFWLTALNLAAAAHLFAQPTATVVDSIVLEESGDDYLALPAPGSPTVPAVTSSRTSMSRARFTMTGRGASSSATDAGAKARAKWRKLTSRCRGGTNRSWCSPATAPELPAGRRRVR